MFLLCTLFACIDESEDPDTNPVDTTTASYKGDFVASAHPMSGTASINQGKTTLSFTNFASHSGPDLNIYLASNLSNIKANHLDLGDIKGLNGNYSYDLPSNVDFDNYKYVVVWCVDFDVNFGYATLVKQ